jgi:hypothetical protein
LKDEGATPCARQRPPLAPSLRATIFRFRSAMPLGSAATRHWASTLHLEDLRIVLLPAGRALTWAAIPTAPAVTIHHCYLARLGRSGFTRTPDFERPRREQQYAPDSGGEARGVGSRFKFHPIGQPDIGNSMPIVRADDSSRQLCLGLTTASARRPRCSASGTVALHSSSAGRRDPIPRSLQA